MGVFQATRSAPQLRSGGARIAAPKTFSVMELAPHFTCPPVNSQQHVTG